MHFLSLFAFSLSLSSSPLSLKQIILVDAEGSREEASAFDPVVFQSNLELPDQGNKLRDSLGAQYVGKNLDTSLIAEIENSIASYYREIGRPFVYVAANEQDVSNGCLVVTVLEGCVNHISVVCNRYFSDCRILGWSSLRKGERLNRGDLYDDLAWMNRNPYRIVDAVFSPGNVKGTTNVEYVVTDRFPLRTYAGLDNTGNDFTGNNRLFAGINWGNAFGLDHVFSYQYTTDDQFKRMQGHTAYYQIPLSWKNMLTLYGGYSYVDTKFDLPGVDLNRFRNNGYSGQLSMRYDIPLPSYAGITQEITWGTDWKIMNNAILFNEVSIDPRKVNLFQLVLKYSFAYDIDVFRLYLDCEAFGNPGRWLPDQSNADYASIRPFAKNVYIYGRCLAKLFWQFADSALFTLQLRGQGASANLLPSEQLGVGGYSSVRGYKERQLNGDNGFLLNAEIQTNPISLVEYFGKQCHWIDQFQLLAFFDFGLSNVHKRTVAEEDTVRIYSIGPGARYIINPYLTLKGDWGYQLNHLEGSGPNNRFHFYATLAY